jgi:hypothetical protein
VANTGDLVEGAVDHHLARLGLTSYGRLDPGDAIGLGSA